jgi:putative transposase
MLAQPVRVVLDRDDDRVVRPDVGPQFRNSSELEEGRSRPGRGTGRGARAIMKSKLTEEQVVYALRLPESTFYVLKKKCASPGVAEMRQLRQLSEENARLKRLAADLTLDQQTLQEVIKEKI